MIVSLKQYLNIALRFSTLGVRFIFVFFLAKYLDAGAVGYYGLFTATIAYALYCVGLDYYVFTTREIAKVPNDRRGRMIKSQATLAGVLYLALLPVAVVMLGRANWPEHLPLWFVPILMLEHINQELSRLLIVLSEQIAASLLLFVRQGSWAIAVVVVMALSKSSRTLDVAMSLWCLAGVAAAALGLWKVRRLGLGGWRDSVDWPWIRKGIAVSGTFLIATLALRAIQTVDRYWLRDIAGIEVVGAYVLFLGVAGALMVFLDAGVFSFTYPELIHHFHNDERDMVRTKVRRMLYQTLAVSAAFSVISLLTLPYLLRWIGKPIYVSELYLYYWVLAANVINAVGMVPHYALYTHGRDRPIVISHVAALPVFAGTSWFLSHVYVAAAIPIGLCAAFSFVLIWKTAAYIRISHAENRQILSSQF